MIIPNNENQSMKYFDFSVLKKSDHRSSALRFPSRRDQSDCVSLRYKSEEISLQQRYGTLKNSS
jgi:hypothetical protein